LMMTLYNPETVDTQISNLSSTGGRAIVRYDGIRPLKSTLDLNLTYYLLNNLYFYILKSLKAT
jgi:hypothetical protein